ncbi:hypothetical protein OB919_04885 [Halobacteria archaeon AArc-curdl1]|uniref:DNA recombination and repair protein Rad51-like C-terminal domain-containing protein n=1 Tax=Natronosalvus hydrolyticus TaxID=2979988 RepID=A0AAP2Z712_9EURY|nr:hypothetical protein [Halobacteria archaeon AArc-curdl1]
MSKQPISNGDSPRIELTPDRPTRGADRNRTLVDGPNASEGDPLLPTLEPGLTLLDVDGGRGVPALQSLVLDHLLSNEGPAFWIDTDGHATTTSLARLAPSRRVLERIHVSRGFTAYQHYGAICDLRRAINRAIRTTACTRDEHPPKSGAGNCSRLTPSLLVVPALDGRYRREDSLRGEDAHTLQSRALARLVAYANSYDVPVLLTRTADDGFSAPLEAAADQHIRCEQTRMGPRFVGEDFETLVYPSADGRTYQTTIAYWRQVLEARVATGTRTSTPTPAAGTPDDGIGVARTSDGGSATFTANPMLDAWTGAAGAGGR